MSDLEVLFPLGADSVVRIGMSGVLVVGCGVVVVFSWGNMPTASNSLTTPGPAGGTWRNGNRTASTRCHILHTGQLDKLIGKLLRHQFLLKIQ